MEITAKQQHFSLYSFSISGSVLLQEHKSTTPPHFEVVLHADNSVLMPFLLEAQCAAGSEPPQVLGLKPSAGAAPSSPFSCAKGPS